MTFELKMLCSKVKLYKFKVISFQLSFIMTAVYYCKWRPQWVTVVGPTYCTCKLTNHSVRTTEPVCYFQICLLNGNFRQCNTVHLEIGWLDKEYDLYVPIHSTLR